MTQIKSALTGIYPTKITESGEKSSQEELNKDLARMSNLIHNHAKNTWSTHSTLITQEISKLGTKNIPYKRDFLRKTCNINNSLPRQKDCLIGLMKEIADHKTISEAETYIKNPNPYKQPFKYNKNIDLSIANNNLAKINYSENPRELNLTIRVMEKPINYSLLSQNTYSNAILLKSANHESDSLDAVTTPSTSQSSKKSTHAKDQ